MPNQRKLRLILVTGVIAALAAAGVLAATNLVTSEEGSGAVDFAKITPFVVGGLEQRTAVYNPDATKFPNCLLPADEKPHSDLPPLSCRNPGAEPPKDLIKTPKPDELPTTGDADLPGLENWTSIDNREFRYTIAMPPGWFSNMRPEGGEFTLFDTIAAQETGTKVSLPGGSWIAFTAREALTPDSRGLDLFPEEKLRNPNTMFGDTPGVIWQEAGGEDIARVIRAAFIRDGVIFEAYAAVQEDATQPSIDGATSEVQALLATIRPY